MKPLIKLLKRNIKINRYANRREYLTSHLTTNNKDSTKSVKPFNFVPPMTCGHVVSEQSVSR